MKTNLIASLRAFALAVALLPASVAVFAKDSSTSDRANQVLSTQGWVSVLAAGPYVERGTFRIQVSEKLGRPNTILADGTWLYENRAVEGSAASGTLIVRFSNGRVSDLAIAAPRVIAALRADPRQTLAAVLVAKN